MSKQVGQRKVRVDAFDKATGRAMYTDDLCGQDALVVRLVHATVAHGLVKSIDTAAAEQMEGVVKILTCFDVPNYPFPTAGHPWSTDPHHQDVADRLLMNRHVRYYGDEVAAVVAENEVAADRAARLVQVEYETYPFVLDPQEAMQPDAPQIHEDHPGNILGHSELHIGDYDKAIQEPGLLKVEGWYDTPTVQHCHIETTSAPPTWRAGGSPWSPPPRSPTSSAGLRPGPGHPLGQGAHHQALHRRGLRQQAGCPV